MFIPDIAAGLVSIRYGLKGPNFATVSACASSAHAIGESFNLIRHGVADAMVTGGAEAAITGLTVAAFSNMKALSTPQRLARDRQPAVRPGPRRLRARRRRRDRGAGEPRARRARGAPGSWARCWATAPAATPTTSRRRRSTAKGAQRAMRACLADGGIDPKRRGLHQRPRHLHAAGRRRGDRGGQGGVRRAGAEAGLRLDQVDDRAPAGRRRRAGVRGLAPGGRPAA